MDCKKVQKLISGAHDVRHDRAVEEHLAACADCAKYQAEIKKLDVVIKQSGRHELPAERWKNFWPSIAERLDRNGKDKLRKAWALLHVASRRVVLTAAGFLLLVSISLNFYMFSMGKLQENIFEERITLEKADSEVKIASMMSQVPVRDSSPGRDNR